ncbi:MAG: hypothetical protein KTR26_08225 [Flammeovirgaceae bacterium]|nr:hypothetical protein [Flammeovirgaceae bacterium]
MREKRFWVGYHLKSILNLITGFINPDIRVKTLSSVFIFFFFNSFLSFSQQSTLPEIRILFNEAVQQEDKVDDLIGLIEKEKMDSPKLLAYMGGAKALEAKSCFNPITKLKYLSRSMDMLNEAVTLSPKDIEIRFLRFSIQYYTPKWLGYSKNLEEDKSMIISNIHNYKSFGIDPGVLDWIEVFMIDSGYCNKEEIEIIRLAKR